jgi:hypothetical protein
LFTFPLGHLTNFLQKHSCFGPFLPSGHFAAGSATCIHSSHILDAIPSLEALSAGVLGIKHLEYSALKALHMQTGGAGASGIEVASHVSDHDNNF